MYRDISRYGIEGLSDFRKSFLIQEPLSGVNSEKLSTYQMNEKVKESLSKYIKDTKELEFVKQWLTNSIKALESDNMSLSDLDQLIKLGEISVSNLYECIYSNVPPSDANSMNGIQSHSDKQIYSSEQEHLLKIFSSGINSYPSRLERNQAHDNKSILKINGVDEEKSNNSSPLQRPSSQDMHNKMINDMYLNSLYTSLASSRPDFNSLNPKKQVEMLNAIYSTNQLNPFGSKLMDFNGLTYNEKTFSNSKPIQNLLLGQYFQNENYNYFSGAANHGTNDIYSNYSFLHEPNRTFHPSFSQMNQRFYPSQRALNFANASMIYIFYYF